MDKKTIWIHEDHLRLADDEQGFFIWDEEYLKEMDYGLKKLTFIYETLCEMGVTIYKGAIEDVIPKVIDEQGLDQIHCYETPNPLLNEKINAVKAKTNLNVLREQPFVKLDKQPDLKRFFRYWNKAKKHAFKTDGGFDSNQKEMDV